MPGTLPYSQALKQNDKEPGKGIGRLTVQPSTVPSPLLSSLKAPSPVRWHARILYIKVADAVSN